MIWLYIYVVLTRLEAIQLFGRAVSGLMYDLNLQFPHYFVSLIVSEHNLPPPNHEFH